MIALSAKKSLYRLGLPRHLSWRRLKFVDTLLDGKLLLQNGTGMKVLDVGCANGKDLVSFLEDRRDLEIVGLDLKDRRLRQPNFQLVLGDAAHLPFPDAYFDLAVSIGVLEHILPLEKLSRVAREIRRVARAYVVIVPSLSTLVEPHTARLLWHIRDRCAKPPYGGPLFYMSDEAWLALEGFRDAESCRFGHLPPLINNLIIFEDRRRKSEDGW